MSAIETVKAHPVLVIGGGAVIFVIVYMLASGGSTATVSGDTSSAVSAADEQQAALQASAEHDAVSLQALQLQGTNQLNLAGIAADLQRAQINASQETTDLANTLTANVQMKNLDTSLAVVNSNNNASEVNTATQAKLYKSLAEINATTVQTIAANQCHGLSCIF